MSPPGAGRPRSRHRPTTGTPRPSLDQRLSSAGRNGASCQDAARGYSHGLPTARAIAAWERTLISPPAPLDRWIAGDSAAVSDAAKRGSVLFNGKALCGNGHRGWNFTDSRAHEVGLGSPDRGRRGVARISPGRRFKTPGLREVGAHAPSMHDGSLPTLEALVDHDAEHRVRRGGAIWEVPLDAAQRADLVAFLRSLDSGARSPV